MSRFHLYCVANNAGVLARDLQSSPEIAERSVALTVLWNEASASSAYARAIGEADADYLVFAHQDIYLPRGWFAGLSDAVIASPEWTTDGPSPACSAQRMVATLSVTCGTRRSA